MVPCLSMIAGDHGQAARPCRGTKVLALPPPGLYRAFDRSPRQSQRPAPETCSQRSKYEDLISAGCLGFFAGLASAKLQC